MEYWFKVVKGTNEGRVLSLKPGITLIGRLDTPTSQDPAGSLRWTIHDPTVSRTHCAITWVEGKLPRLTHLSRTNDTLVDGMKVQEHDLLPEQLVQVGLTHMVFHKTEKKVAPPPPPPPPAPSPSVVAEETMLAPPAMVEETSEPEYSETADDWKVDVGEDSSWTPATLSDEWRPDEASHPDESDAWNPR